VAGLARERDGYIRTGRPDRAIAVDEQLALRGVCVDQSGQIVPIPEPDLNAVDDTRAPDAAGEKRDEGADTTPPRGRTTRKRQTTAASGDE